MDCSPNRGAKAGDDMRGFAVSDWSEITLTHRCNQRCFFCYEEGRNIAREPDLEEVKRLLKKTSERANLIVLCGKEVLLRRDILDIVRFAASTGLKVAVFSNGQALAKKGFVAELAEAGCTSIAISFHFPDAETFAIGARAKPEGFRRIISGIENIRDYNLAHPEKPLKVSTETDMFILNLGRLKDIRKILIEAFGNSPWSMRIGSLLPTKIFDIGFEHILEPINKRREELEDFIASHPPNLPLAFVKTPLCMLPSGEEHRTLEAKYIYEGTVLTFNHVEADMITSDTLSVSAHREIEKNLRSHPYRWICSKCSLIPMCRYDRVDWFHKHFEPTKEQKPSPYSDMTVSDVLSRFGEIPAIAKDMEKIACALKKRRFPEEEIIEALSRREAGEPELTDVWIDRIPLFVVLFKHRGFTIPLQLVAPSGREEMSGADAVIDWLIVRSSAEKEVPRNVIKDCLDRIAGLLPPAERMQGEAWFNIRTAALFRSAWKVFRDRIWVGSGSIGRWKAKNLAFRKTGMLFIEMLHPSRVKAEVRYEIGTNDQSEIITLKLKSKGKSLPSGDFSALADFIGMRVAGSPLSLAGHPFQDLLDGKIALCLKNGTWRLLKSGAGVSPPGSLLFVVRDPAFENIEYRFHVAEYLEGMPFFKRVERFVLWYSHHPMTERAGIFADALVDSMKRLQHSALSPESLPEWRDAVAARLKTADLHNGFEWKVNWEGSE